MKRILLVLCLSLPTFVLAQSNAGPDVRTSGADYARLCGPTSEGSPDKYTPLCNVWLTGVIDGLYAYNANLRVLPLFDEPANLSIGQLSKLVVKYVGDHPDKAKLPTAAVVLGTLMENVPKKDTAAKP